MDVPIARSLPGVRRKLLHYCSILGGQPFSGKKALWGSGSTLHPNGGAGWC